jgi:prophage antirepressor-like protein
MNENQKNASEIVTFDFKSSPVRVFDRAGQTWFVAADVCRALDISNHRDAVQGLEDDEKGVAIADTLGGAQKIQTISESGLYALIFKSRKPEAKAFRKWVTGEVLPAIRRTGGYAVLTGIGRIQQVLELAICDLYEGRMSVEKATAMAGLVGQYYRNGWKLGQATETTQALEVLDGEHREFSALVAALWSRDQDKEWSSLEMRQVAVAEGLFSTWLKTKTILSPSIASRFGLLCDRQCSKAFDGILFQRHGKNRSRVFTLTQLSVNP